MSLVENFKSFVTDNRTLVLIVFSLVAVIILYYLIFLTGNKYKCTEAGCVFSLRDGSFKTKKDCSTECSSENNIESFEQTELGESPPPETPETEQEELPTTPSPVPRSGSPSTLPSVNRKIANKIDTNLDPSEYEPNEVEEGFTSKFLTDNNVMNVREQINKKKGMNPYFATADDVVEVVTDQDTFPYPRMFRGVPESSVPIVYERETGWRDRHDDAYRSNLEPNLENLGIFQDACEDKKDKSHGDNDQKNPKQLHFCSADINKGIQASYFYCNEQQTECYDDSPKYCTGAQNESGYVFCYNLSPRDDGFATPINPDDSEDYVQDNDALYCSANTLQVHNCTLMALDSNTANALSNSTIGGVASLSDLSTAAAADGTTVSFTTEAGTITVEREGGGGGGGGGGGSLIVGSNASNFTITMTFTAAGVFESISVPIDDSVGVNTQYAAGYRVGDVITISAAALAAVSVTTNPADTDLTITLTADSLVNVGSQQVNNRFSCWSETENCNDDSPNHCPTMITEGPNMGTHTIQHRCEEYVHSDGTPGWSSSALGGGGGGQVAPVPNSIFSCRAGDGGCADNSQAYCAEIEWSGDDDLIQRFELHNCSDSKAAGSAGYYFFCPAQDSECRDNSDKYCVP